MSPRPAVLLSCCLVAATACGGDAHPVDATVATVEPIRGALEIGGDRAAPLGRVAPDQVVSAAEAALGRLRLDSGPRLLVGPGARVEVIDAGAVQHEAGSLFAQVESTSQLEIRLGEAGGTLRASDTALSLESVEGGRAVYVVRGEVSFRVGDRRGVAHAGERLRLIGESVEVEPAALWTDWTGGLARPGLSGEGAPEGVGSLEARVPDEVGLARWPLVARRLDVRVRIEGDYAVTEVDQVFFNPASETVEGIYRFRAPEEAVLQRFAVDRDGALVDGFVRERAQAQQAYEQQVYRGSTDDPALLVWDAPGAYRARIYPIAAGETRRIVIRYAEWLRPRAAGAPRIYRYPMGGGARPPHIQEFSLEVDLDDARANRVRAGMDASIEGDRVLLRSSDFVPQADFWLELFDEADRRGAHAYRGEHRPPRRAPGARAIPNEADERDYYYLPLVLPTSLAGEANERRQALDLVIVADISAATDRSRLELGRSVVDSLTAHLGPEDQVAIVTSDLTIRPLGGEEAPALGPASPERLEALLDGLARVPAGGATDLGAAIAAASELLDPARLGAVVYVGDGAPTVGELGAEGLLQRMARLPRATRLYAVAVGEASNLDLLAALTRGGGLALRVEDRADAAEAALRLLAHAGRPLAQRVTVELGAGIDNAFPRGPVDVVLGEVLSVVGRVRDDVPRQVTVTGTIGGQEFTETVDVQTTQVSDPTDLRLRWAGERLRQLLLEGAGREAVAELGTRCGLITPYTSFYVPSARELRESGGAWLLREQPLLLDHRQGPAPAQTALSAILGLVTLPLSITGCERAPTASQSAGGEMEPESIARSPTSSPGTTEVPAVAGDESAATQHAPSTRHRGEEGQMGRRDATKSDNRFGIRGPADNPEPHMARERAREDVANNGVLAALESAAEPSEDSGGRDFDRRSSAATGQEQLRNQGYLTTDSDGDDLNDLAGAEANAPAKRMLANPIGTAQPDEGPTSPFGSDTAAGTDAEDALGALMGSQIDDNFGASGLGLRGTGRGGGGTGEGTIGLGQLNTIGHGGGGGSGSGYGRGAGGLQGRRASIPTIRTGTAEVNGSLSKEVIRRYIRRHINEVRYCYEQQLARQPDLAGRVNVRFVINPSGAVTGSTVASSTLSSPAAEQCVAQVVSRIAFPEPEGGGLVVVNYPFMFQSAGDDGSSRSLAATSPAEVVPSWVTSSTTTTVTTTVTRWNQRSHRLRRCSDAAVQPLDDRQALWGERLGRANSVAGWVEVYRSAIRGCEAPRWRDRRALLQLIIGQAGSVARMIEVHRAIGEPGAQRYLREAIFRRVRTPEDLRLVRAQFGVSSAVDWELIERLLTRARDVNERIRLLRELLGLYPRSSEVAQTFPDSFELKLRLLAALEEAGRLVEARRLAQELRADPLADAGVRTTLGEMYLRLGDEAEARRVFSEIVEFAPYDGAARRRLGDLYRAHGWFEDAYRQYQTLSEIRPDDQSVLLLLAQAAAGAGRVDEAIRLEQRLAETAEPGAAAGLPRVAILWSSVRFAKLRKAAQEASDTERLRALIGRMRRTGILREAGALRVSLTWSHPDAGLSLWAAHPGLGLTRPNDIAPEFGIEAFDLREAEPGRYRLEVRRQAADQRTPVEAQLVIVWNEGQADEQILIRPLRFEGDSRGVAFTLEGQALTEAELSEDARREVRR